MRFFVILFLVFVSSSMFSSFASAQLIPDAASFTYTKYGSDGDQAFEFKTGLPPVRISNAMFIGSITLRQTRLSGDGMPNGDKLLLSDHSTGLLMLLPSDNPEEWSFTGRIGVNYGNASPSLIVKHEAAFPNGFALISKNFHESKNWRYGLGLIYLGKGSRIPAAPAAQFEYSSEDKIYQAIIGFPLIQASYGISKSERVGAFATFISNSYLLPEDSQLRPSGDYIGYDRVVAGFFGRHQLWGLLWLNTRVGYSVWGKTTLRSGEMKKVRTLDDESDLFLQVGLGVAIPEQKKK